LLAGAVRVARLAGTRSVVLRAVDAVDDRVAVATRAAARLVVDVTAGRSVGALAGRFALAGPAAIRADERDVAGRAGRAVTAGALAGAGAGRVAAAHAGA